MNSQRDITLIQHVTAKGFQLFGKLLILSNQFTVERQDISDISDDVAITSSVLQHFVNLMEQKHGEVGMIDRFGAEALSTASCSASSCARAFDDIEHSLVRSRHGQCDGSRQSQEDLRTTLGETRRKLLAVIADTPLMEQRSGESARLRCTSTARRPITSQSALKYTHRHKSTSVVDPGPNHSDSNNEGKNLTEDSSFTLRPSIAGSPGTSRKVFDDNAFGGSPISHEQEKATNSTDDSILEACTIMPTIHSTDRGYDVEWLVAIMPLQESDVRKELRRLQEMDPRSLCEQLDSLTPKERCALEDFIALTPSPPNGSRWPHQEHIVLLAVVVEHKEPTEELERFLGNISGRRVKLVIRCKRHSNAKGRVDSPNSYPWLRVHYRYLSTRLLNDRGIPWEWDRSYPGYIIVKRWVPQVEQDMLFEQSRGMREARQLIIDVASPQPFSEEPALRKQDPQSNSMAQRRRFCKPLTNTLVRFGFIRGIDRDQDIAKEAVKSRHVLQNNGQYYEQREPEFGGGEKVAELWKTRKDIEMEIEELERQRTELRIQKRNEEKQDKVEQPIHPTKFVPHLLT